MTNADKFKSIFGIYATELWAKSEEELIEWLNSETEEQEKANKLIYVEKLKQYIEDCEFCYKCPDKEFRCEITCEMPSCLTKQWERAIDEQPTVDAAPVIHAHWEEDEYCYECSWCGMGSEVDYDYCPNCGAKMDERKDEDN